MRRLVGRLLAFALLSLVVALVFLGVGLFLGIADAQFLPMPGPGPVMASGGGIVHVFDVCSTTGVATVPLNATAANFFVAVVGSADGTGQAMSDSVNLTVGWVKRSGFGSGINSTIWYIQNPGTGAAQTFIESGSVSGFCVSGFSGMVTSGVYESQSAGAQNTSASIQPGSVTPGTGNQLIVTALGMYTPGGGTVTIDGSFSTPVVKPFAGGVNYGVATSYLIQSGTAAANPTWSISIASTGLAATSVVFQGQ